MKKQISMLLATACAASLLAACGQKDNGGSKDSDEKVLTYAVEGGSAGEEIALEKGWKITTLEDQAAALMEVASGTSDAAIIDLLMAGAMIGEGTSYPDLTYTDRLTEEEYGIGCRKGSDLAQYINCVLGDAYQSGTIQKLAQQYGITEELLVPQQESTFTTGEDSDVSYIQQKGTLVVGITEFAPMDYKDENGQWIGFDADLAKLVAERLGVEIQFVVIDWGQKINELDSKAIDVVWNGMTLTEDIMANTATTKAYAKNAQVVVVKDGTDYTSTADLADKTVVAEAGSAGEAAIQGDENLSKADYVSKSVQTDCLMEVAAGTADAAVLDLTLANAMIGAGTDYASLKIVDELNAEEYGVAFRKGSDAAAAVDAAFDELKADGTMQALADKYDLALAE